MPNKELEQRLLSSLDKIIRTLNQWIPLREDSIRLLKKIADELDNFKSQVNTAKITGAGASIVGGALLGMGALATFLTMGAVAPIVYAGVAASLGGGILSGGAEVKMMLDDISKQKRAKQILEVDKSKQDEVLKEAQNFRDLITQVSREENISKEEALKNLLQTFLNRGHSGASTTRKKEKEMQDLHEMKIKALLQNSALTSFIYRTPRLFLIAGAAVIAEGSLLVGGRLVREAARAFTPIMVAIDTFQFYTTTIDAYYGSKSNLGQQLREIADELEAELRENMPFKESFEYYIK